VKFLSPAISRLARMRWWKIDQWMQDPVATQYEVWQQLIADAQYTKFGREYHFSNIHSIVEFQQKVPIQHYETIQPYIAKMMEGEENVLWNTPVEWFAKSSGTTDAKSKFIPVSYESLEENHFLAAKDVLSFYYNNNPGSDLLTGKGLVIGGSHQVHSHNDQIQYGDVSAVIMQNGPFWSQWLRTPGLEIALMNEWESKIEKMAEASMVENVTSLAGVPTWTIVLLKKILEKSGAKTIAEVWPNLELYLHGGVNFTPYKEQFNTLIGKPMHYIDVYNASEGFFAAQNSLDDDGLILFTNHGVFYEFILLEDLHLPHPKAYTVENVSIGVNYAMVISTSGGLWRYIIGDTVQFVSLHPYKIKITGRTKHFINAFGEELVVDNADEALTVACSKTNAIINDYTAAPIYFSQKENGAHEWLIEFEKEPDNMAAFSFELDIALQSINSDYEAKRYRNLALRQPLIQVVPRNSFNKWLKEKGKLGGQHKVPRLSNNRTTLEEIKAMIALLPTTT
jgi:GH3 auxin-responsive promoter